jgi:HlyD family secretion protein
MAREATVTAESGLAEIRAAVEVAQAALADTRMLAPFDGLVVAVHVEKGESLMVGAPVLDIMDDSHVTVEATVDEADAGRLKQEMPVRVHSDAFPDRAFEGRLTWISPVVAQDLRQNRHLDIEVGLNGDAALLKVGMSTDVEVIVTRRENTLYVPTNAIMRKGDRQQVYVILAGRARLRDLQVGLSNWERSEVLEGLRDGEAVVISLGEKGLKDGVKVRTPGVDGRMAQ